MHLCWFIHTSVFIICKGRQFKIKFLLWIFQSQSSPTLSLQGARVADRGGTTMLVPVSGHLHVASHAPICAPHCSRQADIYCYPICSFKATAAHGNTAVVQVRICILDT